MSPEDRSDDPEAKRLADLEFRLNQARGGRPRPEGRKPPSKIGFAFRLSTEMLAAVVVGGGIGWGLDRVFGTTPFLLIVMVFLGAAAGFRNVVRVTREFDAKAARDDR
jgi:ATP synthase protein I